MKVLFAASEVAGFAKTGGLADVASSLPQALAARGLDVAVLLPLYRMCRSADMPLTPTEHRLRVPIANRIVEGRLWRSTLKNSTVPVYLVEQADYYERDDSATGRGLYQYKKPGGEQADYPDNCERFVFFSRAILEAIRLLNHWPDILHLNDWQTGLAAVYLRELYPQFAARELRPLYADICTVFTVHNLAYQGMFWHLDMPLLGLPWRLFNLDQLEFHGKINFLKAGIVWADLITTVSPMYAREIQTPYFGCGLHGVLRQRSRQLHGIVNGIDEQTWNPALDPNIAANYDVASVTLRKPICKTALQKACQLALHPATPLLGIVSRLAMQKGFELLEEAITPFLRQGVQLVVLGDGDKKYREMLLRLQKSWPQQVGVHLGHDDKLAHRIEAGADAFLMPSQYEPCGLNQLYSLKYGTIPIVRATGGLADTVTDATEENLALGKATGFRFVPFAASPFATAIERCLTMYHERPHDWQQVQRAGMEQDWSWHRSAAEYERLYRVVLQSR